MSRNTKKLLLIPTTFLCAGMLSQSAVAGMKFELNDGKDIFEVGGYVKLDARYVDGTVPYRNFWMGGLNPGTQALAEDKSTFKLKAQETRFNFKYTHGNVFAFVELDFVDPATAQGSDGIENFTNRANDSLRHAFIMYKPTDKKSGSWLLGQSWTTMQNTSAFMETLSFGGPLTSQVFIRQTQIRYSKGNFQVSLENPRFFTPGGGPLRVEENNDTDSLPDLIARYNLKGKWGNVSFSGLLRQVDAGTGANEISETAFGGSIAGRIKAGARDDFRFSYNKGELGRYVGLSLAFDAVPTASGTQLEDTEAYTMGYRHFWKDSWRSTLYYGHAETDLTNKEITQWGVNLMKNVTKQLSIGVEVGNYDMEYINKDSDYLQFSAKFVI